MIIRPNCPSLRSFIAPSFGVVAVLLAPAFPAAAQNADTAKLPDTIRLIRRGKVNDFYSYKVSSNSSMNFHFKGAGQDKEQTKTEEEKKTTASRTLSISPEGNIKIKSMTLSGTKITEEDGEQKTRPSELKGYVSIYTPNNRRISHTLLTPAKGAKKASQNQDDSDEDVETGEPPFPEKDLHVGDTWSGTLKMLPKSLSETQEVAYTAQLDAIEMHNNMPCAKVIYKLEKTLDEMPPAMRKGMPPSAMVKGNITLNGTVTEFYRLDRGEGIATDLKASLTIKYTVSVTNPNDGTVIDVVIEGGGEFSEQDSVTKMPEYDASLIPASKP